MDDPPPPEQLEQATARRLPGLTQRKPPCFAFGEAQYRIANTSATIATGTGRFTMFHVVTAAPPAPIHRPGPARPRRMAVPFPPRRRPAAICHPDGRVTSMSST
jgi:hypothetical protein